jgi:ADP-heptose:LPS heptosyltransferase
MRGLDFWLGMPLCFVLSVVDRIASKLLIKRSNKNEFEKIVFIKLSEMGAISLAYPLLMEVKKSYPQAELFFITFEKNKPFFGVLGGIIEQKNIFTIRETSLRFLLTDSVRVFRKIRKEKMDIAFDLEMLTRFSAILTYLTGAIKKIGFNVYNFEGLYRGNFFTHNVQYNPLQHISHSYLSLGKVAQLERKNTPEFKLAINDAEIILPKFSSEKSDYESLVKKIGAMGVTRDNDIFLTNPGEWGYPFNLREWPLEYYIDLVKKLLAGNPNRRVVLVGNPGALDKAGKLCRAVDSSRCVDFTGKTTISELLELFLISRALITSDSGLAHFAALTPLPKFIFFGPETPQVFGPLGENTHIFFSKLPCSPCFSVFNHRNSACKNNHCLKGISSEYVYNYIIKTLG